MPKFQIDLPDDTYHALAAMALDELRQIPQQAAWVIIQAMREREEKRQVVRLLPSQQPLLDLAAAVGGQIEETTLVRNAAWRQRLASQVADATEADAP